MLLQTNASFAVFLNLRCSTGTRRSGDIDSQYYQSVQHADWCMPVDDTEMRWYGAYNHDCTAGPRGARSVANESVTTTGSPNSAVIGVFGLHSVFQGYRLLPRCDGDGCGSRKVATHPGFEREECVLITKDVAPAASVAGSRPHVIAPRDQFWEAHSF